jgi:four helix bundle protein
MFLQVAYKNLDLYTLSKKLVVACYEITQMLPEEEKTNLSVQIRTAALSAYFNIVRGLFRKSNKKRKKHFKLAKESFQVIDASLEVLFQLQYIRREQLDEIENSLLPCYRLLKKILKNKS